MCKKKFMAWGAYLDEDDIYISDGMEVSKLVDLKLERTFDETIECNILVDSNLF